MNPELSLDILLLRGLFCFAALVTIAFFFQRYRWRRRKGKGKSNWGFYPSAASMGNALQELSVLAQPQVEHILEEKQSEDTEEEDESGPKDPTVHLHRQATKLRRGQKVDQLTAILKQ
jgi:hypothetical protein